MLNSPEPSGEAPAAGQQQQQQQQPAQQGSGGEQPRPAMTISVTAQEKEAIDRVG